MSLRFYSHAKCDTCRKALKYLSERGLEPQEPVGPTCAY